jgi:citrate synthase
MTDSSRRMRSSISWSTPDQITVRGFDLSLDLMGTVNLGDMAYLELLGCLPTPEQSVLFNAMLVSLVEHGITPSTLAARLTYLGAPESLQGAVAAGLLGVGSVFVGTIEGAARVLQESLAAETSDADLPDLAGSIVNGFRARGEHIPGIGHPIHKLVDPRAVRLFALADELNLSGRYVTLMRAIGAEAGRQANRTLPINVTGAIGALASELEIPWAICRGIGVMARAIGLVGHLLEELREPLAANLWRSAEHEAQRPPNPS